MRHNAVGIALAAVIVAAASVAALAQTPAAPAPAGEGAPKPATPAAPSGAEPAKPPAGQNDSETLPPPPEGGKPSPQRFEPTEKVRPDFDVAFPVDI